MPAPPSSPWPRLRPRRLAPSPTPTRNPHPRRETRRQGEIASGEPFAHGERVHRVERITLGRLGPRRRGYGCVHLVGEQPKCANLQHLLLAPCRALLHRGEGVVECSRKSSRSVDQSHAHRHRQQSAPASPPATGTAASPSTFGGGVRVCIGEVGAASELIADAAATHGARARAPWQGVRGQRRQSPRVAPSRRAVARWMSECTIWSNEVVTLVCTRARAVPRATG